ncbi:hypothetical protein SPSIL_053170 [Sporomusa silvacetica DSM 10669]|uniref:DUF445 domain-containing protein n=1 Tax=Sporomusa silvacetica DSM 10669 TaxID=1123289 RepID=A0ABZ3IUP1_9FIRM|nr:DUF445 domain-containing protein [Sporomusa silvacetica]OZC19593.1 hypothetical protein SPSIL_20220 [Sporomusa silvacetica DSM 10669]
MNVNNAYKAGLTLIGAATGFALSYPLQYSFWGGLIHSGFGAAMVGGLADWYAVTALFRKPLSIPYRTAIIPKNRDRIFKAIVTMVEEEIVTAANIKETLENAGIARLVLSYVNKTESRQQLYSLAGGVAREAVYAMDATKLSTALELLLQEHQDKVRLAPLSGQALEWSLAKGFADKVIELAIAEIKHMAGEPYLTELIASIYTQALNAYAARKNQRKLVGWLIENLLNLDPMTVAALIQDKLVSLLEELESGRELPLRLRLRAWLAEFASGLQQDSVLAAKAEAVLRPLLVKLAEHVADLPTSQPELTVGWVTWVVKQLAKLADEAAADEQKMAWVDRYLAVLLARWVSQNHGQIGQIVNTYLESFSNDELVVYIEDKVLDDLQMIRINGSVVGGLVGMLLFLISYAVGVKL